MYMTELQKFIPEIKIQPNIKVKIGQFYLDKADNINFTIIKDLGDKWEVESHYSALPHFQLKKEYVEQGIQKGQYILQKFIKEIKVQPNMDSKKILEEILQSLSYTDIENLESSNNMDEYMNEFDESYYTDDPKGRENDINLAKNYFTYLKGKIKVSLVPRQNIYQNASENYKNIFIKYSYAAEEMLIILHNFGQLSVS